MGLEAEGFRLQARSRRLLCHENCGLFFKIPEALAVALHKTRMSSGAAKSRPSLGGPSIYFKQIGLSIRKVS
jgi:hypothetical protein